MKFFVEWMNPKAEANSAAFELTITDDNADRTITFRLGRKEFEALARDVGFQNRVFRANIRLDD